MHTDEVTTSSRNDGNTVLPAALSVKDGNELIAKFMGGVKQIIPKGGLHGYKQGTELWMSVFSSNPDPLSYLSFNDEWDWIMPVVERIESMGYTFKICRRRVEIDVDGEHPPYPMILCKEKTKILSAWKACIEFIRVCPKGSR